MQHQVLLLSQRGNGSEAYRCEAYNSYDDGYNCDTAYFYLDVKDTIDTVRYYVNDAEVEDGDIYNTKPGKQYRLRVEPESSYSEVQQPMNISGIKMKIFFRKKLLQKL